MRIDTRSDNNAVVTLQRGETLHFPLKYLRGRAFGVPLIPPCPLGSPLARLVHGCYWMGTFTATRENTDVILTGPTVIGRFQVVELADHERWFVDCRRLAGFTFGNGGLLQTAVYRCLSPTMWALGHPLPVMARGPGQLILYGEGLTSLTVEPGTAYIPEQVCAFAADTSFRATALTPDRGLLSHLANVLGHQTRWVFPEPTRMSVLPINPPDRHVSRVLLHALIHLGAVLALVWLWHA